MTKGAQSYDIAAIRQLLLAAFTAEEFPRFCYDRPDFQPVVKRFGPDHGLDDMVDELITYCDTHLLFGRLLTQVRQTNPGQYARFAPYHRREPKSPAATTLAVPAPEKASAASSSLKPGPKSRTDWLIIASSAAAILALIVAVLAWIATSGDGEPTPQPSQPPAPTDTAGPPATSPTPTPTHTSETPLPIPTPTDTPTSTATATNTPTLTATSTPTATPTPSPTPTPTPISPPATCHLGDTWTRPTDGMVMVCVPAGEFLMGSTDSAPGIKDREKPQHTVYLDAFWIDKYEVTNAQYQECVEAGHCRQSGCRDDSDLNPSNQPVVCVDWHEAQGYAAWVRGRLPTEAEWEKAARGTDGRIYPWGDSPPDCYKANNYGCAGKPLPVGTHPDGASPYGALDMAGNVLEWVADWYAEDYYARSPFRDPQGPESGDYRVMRDAAYDNAGGYARCTYRNWENPAHWRHSLGFRVVVAPGTSSP